MRVPWRGPGSSDTQLIAESGGEPFTLALPAKGGALCAWRGRVSDIASPSALFVYPEWMNHLASAIALRLEPGKLAAPSTSNEVEPSIDADGSGLATALAHLKLSAQPGFDALQASVRRVVPLVEELGFRRVKKFEKGQRADFVDGQVVFVPHTTESVADELTIRFAGTEHLPAQSASEGTLLVLGVLAVLHLPGAPKLLLLDDIERGLHPSAQKEFVSCLREVLKARPDTQIIATTHSPYLVDSFAPEEVNVLSRDGHGAVRARLLSEHPDKKLRDILTPGEFLAASGPDWFGL